MKAAQSTTYLTYSMTSSQNPLEVSPSPQNPSVANLTFVASCPESVGECTVRQIEIALPVGDPNDMDATDLTEVTPPPSAASISSSDGAAWNVTPGVDPGSFVFTPQAGTVLMASQALTFIVAGIQISPLVGTAEITISEWAAPSTYTPPAPPHLPSGTSTIDAPKFPAGFYAFDFAPSSPEVNSGETVTLTWVGSTNATYTIAYSDQQPTDVTNVRTWTSPPLYTTTAFVLTASASVAGQTVSLSLSTTVVVASPQVVSFYPVPSEIDFNEQVVLNWRAIDADGVYLLTGQTQRLTLPAVSDPNHPQTLQPQYGASYALQAFKNQGGSQVVSAAVPLSFTFNPIAWTTLKADPTTVDLQTPSTTVTWEVDHAVNVFLNGGKVGASGAQVMNPTAPSSYGLTATWVDGSTQTGPTINVGTVQVGVSGHTISFDDGGTKVTVTLVFTVENATGGTINNASLLYSDRHHWYQWGNHWQTAKQSGIVATQINANTWQFVLTFFPIPPVINAFANVGMQFDWVFNGFVPVGANGELDMWRGSLTFWNGS